MTRRFSVGDTFFEDGMWFRVSKGRKGPDDLRMDWFTPEGWRPFTFRPLFLATDFLTENEEYLYPWPAAGGRYLLTQLSLVQRSGWLAACERLAAEKAAKV